MSLPTWCPQHIQTINKTKVYQELRNRGNMMKWIEVWKRVIPKAKLTLATSRLSQDQHRDQKLRNRFSSQDYPLTATSNSSETKAVKLWTRPRIDSTTSQFWTFGLEIQWARLTGRRKRGVIDSSNWRMTSSHDPWATKITPHLKKSTIWHPMSEVQRSPISLKNGDKLQAWASKKWNKIIEIIRNLRN